MSERKTVIRPQIPKPPDLLDWKKNDLVPWLNAQGYTNVTDLPHPKDWRGGDQFDGQDGRPAVTLLELGSPDWSILAIYDSAR